jgi:flagellar M-ring protein FliF
MPQLKDLFVRLSWTQRAVLALAAAGVIGGLLLLQRWNDERDFKPLVSGLAAEDAGAVAAKLKEAGVEYRLRDDGSTILVPSARVADVRLELASAGLPRSGRIGFELFDKTNFGASEFAEQVNYHRAIEGELERSVMSIREVEQARVHVSLAKDSLYSDQRQPAKASVLVKLRHAAALSPQNVAAICQLTASAVPGLAPEQVTLVDTSGNLLNRPRAAGLEDGGQSGNPSAGAAEYRKSIEHDVETKIAQTLEPLLGAGHFRTGVSADVDLAVAEQSEEIFDPAKSVMASSQTTQDGPAVDSASGVPGTASNLPRPTAKASVAGSSTTNYSRRTENITYQTSRTVKHTRLPQGGVKKISVSVLVDHSLRWEGAKRIVEAPSPAKIKVIQDLVAAAAGLNTERGDQLVVEAFPFESTLNAEPVVLDQPKPPAAQPPASLLGSGPAWLQALMAQKNFALIAAAAGAALMALLVGFVVILRRTKKKKAELTPTLEAAKPRQIGPTPQEVERQIEERLAEQSAEHARKEAEALMALKLPVQTTKKTEVLTKHIAAEAKKDPTSMAHVIRSWLNGEYQR